jgi:alkylated DNA repair dioxygenase AlkB
VWCAADVLWQQEHLRLFGKTHRVPRQIAWFGAPGVNYRYSGLDHTGCGLPPALASLAERLDANHVLLNRYRHGDDYMGWHTDDERGVVGPVHIVSLGAERSLRWRIGAERASVRLAHGSRLLLDGRIPHTLTRTRRPCGERFSLSFRRIADA